MPSSLSLPFKTHLKWNLEKKSTFAFTGLWVSTSRGAGIYSYKCDAWIQGVMFSQTHLSLFRGCALKNGKSCTSTEASFVLYPFHFHSWGNDIGKQFCSIKKR